MMYQDVDAAAAIYSDRSKERLEGNATVSKCTILPLICWEDEADILDFFIGTFERLATKRNSLKA